MLSPKEGTMMRRLIIAITIVFGIITLVGCDKANMPTAPTEATPPVATTPTPLPSPVCTDQKATNYMGLLPCTYPPEGEVRIGLPVGFADWRPGNFGPSAAPSPAIGYSGKVEVRITLNETGTHQLLLVLVNPETNTAIKFVTGFITGSGSISLPHTGSMFQPRVRNIGTVTLSGNATFWYIAD